ncbi:MAG: adenosylcobinamide-GDP ribazoletransferase [Acidimicrobiales bacterium]
MRQALAFLTPLGGARSPTPNALAWFPEVGLAIGMLLGGIWWGAGKLWSPMLAAAIVVACDLGLTGMLHMDGLLDSADGLFLHGTRSRRLEVMHDSSVGAFATAIGGATLLLRWAALASLAANPWLLAGLWAAARALMAIAAMTLPYARPEGGLATAFLGSFPRRWMIMAAAGAGLAVAIGCSALWRSVEGPIAVVVGLVAGVALLVLARRRLGGFTGDVLGAAGVVTETVALVMAAARW